MLTAADMNAVTADGVMQDISTSETTTSTTYTDLATTGPTAALSVVNGQQVLVIIAARVLSSGATVGAAASFAVSGALSLPASDASSIINTDSTFSTTCSRAWIGAATSTATFTATMKYKVTNAGTGTFLERRIVIKKF